MSCGIGHRCGLDLALLCLWFRSVATAPIRPLVWEPPCAVRAALKRQKKKRTQWTSLQNRYWLTHFEKLMVSKGNRLVGVGRWAGGLGWKCSKIGLWWLLYNSKCNKIHGVTKRKATYWNPLAWKEKDFSEWREKWKWLGRRWWMEMHSSSSVCSQEETRVVWEQSNKQKHNWKALLNWRSKYVWPRRKPTKMTQAYPDKIFNRQI